MITGRALQVAGLKEICVSVMCFPFAIVCLLGVGRGVLMQDEEHFFFI